MQSATVSGMRFVKKFGKVVIASWISKQLPNATGWQVLFTLPVGFRPAVVTEGVACVGSGISTQKSALAVQLTTDGELCGYVTTNDKEQNCSGQICFFTE